MLKWIDFVLSVWLGAKPLQDYTPMLDRFWEGRTIEFDVLIFSDGRFFRVISEMERDDDGYFFAEEVILRAPGSTGKNSLMDISKYRETRRRSRLSAESLEFLDRDKSIARSLFKSECPVRVWHLEDSDLPMDEELMQLDSSAVSYFDPAIESLTAKEHTYMLKRVGKEPIEVSYRELVGGLLSTGTLGGLALFSRIKQAFCLGGYVLVDNLEHGFSLRTCAQILDFFMLEAPNRSGAHLVFTTNAEDLVDFLPRNDTVHLCIRGTNMDLDVVNLATCLKRQDSTKSELIAADSFDLGTAVSYEVYIQLKRWLMA